MSQPQQRQGSLIRLPGRQGRVFLNGVDPDGQDFKLNQATRTGHQQPQFMPRVKWPKAAYNTASRQRIRRYGIEVRDGVKMNDREVHDALQRINLDYGRLPVMPHFGKDAEYRNMSWNEHVSHCHDILFHRIPNGRRGHYSKAWLAHVEIQSLLNIVSYGLGESVHFIETEFTITGDTPIPGFGDPPRAFGEVNNETTFMTDDNELREVRKKIEQRRFIVAPIHHTGADYGHWCMSIFDRDERQLYILDTFEKGRDYRIKGICHLWAAFWNRMGIPNHFHYFALPCFQQPGAWECGYLAVAWVMHTLRNGIEEYTMLHPPVNPDRQEDIVLGNYQPNSFPPASSGPLSHWHPPGCPDNIAVRGVMLELEAALCNELGIRDHSSMSKAACRVQDGPTVIEAIEAAAGKLEKSLQALSRPALPQAEFWTVSGGPQFSAGVSDTPLKGIEESEWKHRLHRPQQKGMHPVDYDNPPCSIQFAEHRWNDAQTFTAKNPLLVDMNAPDAKAPAVPQAQDHSQTDNGTRAANANPISALPKADDNKNTPPSTGDDPSQGTGQNQDGNVNGDGTQGGHGQGSSDPQGRNGGQNIHPFGADSCDDSSVDSSDDFSDNSPDDSSSEGNASSRGGGGPPPIPPMPRRLPGFQGRVFLREFPGQHGFMRGEQQDIGVQQPQFMPRVHWPLPQPFTDASRRAIPQASVQWTFDTDYRAPPNLPDPRGQEFNTVLAHYPLPTSVNPPPRLAPMPHFRRDASGAHRYRGTGWAEHVSHCHNLLYNSLPGNQWMSNVQMQSLLSIASYGLERSTYFVENEFAFRPPGQNRDRRYPEFGNKSLPDGVVMFESDFMTNDLTLARIRSEIQGRRFIVAPVHCPLHWCMTIFDRERCELLILDTHDHNCDRIDRIKGICVLWARFWNRMQLPCHFNYFALPCLEQPGGWECGYLGVAWVMNTLRNGVDGQDQYYMPYPVPGDDDTSLMDVHLVNKDERFGHKSSGPLNEWAVPGLPFGREVTGVISMLCAALCNELGISDHPEMQRLPATLISQGIPQGPHTPYHKITQIANQLLNNPPHFQQPQIRSQDFWTLSGGPQFSVGADDSRMLGSGIPRDQWPHHLYHANGRNHQPIYFQPRGPHAPHYGLWVGLRGLSTRRGGNHARTRIQPARLCQPPERPGLVNTDAALRGTRGTGDASKRKRGRDDDDNDAQPRQRRRRR